MKITDLSKKTQKVINRNFPCTYDDIEDKLNSNLSFRYNLMNAKNIHYIKSFIKANIEL